MQIAPAAEIANDPAQIETLTEVLQSVTSAFNALTQGAVDETALRRDLESLSARLAVLGEDFEARTKYLDELSKKLRVREQREALLESIQRESEVRQGILGNLAETWSRVRQTSDIVESVYKLTSKRQVLNRIEHAMTRKVMSQAITGSSVTIEKILDSRRGLDEILKELEEADLGLGEDWKSLPSDHPARRARVAPPEEDEAGAAVSSGASRAPRGEAGGTTGAPPAEPKRARSGAKPAPRPAPRPAPKPAQSPAVVAAAAVAASARPEGVAADGGGAGCDNERVAVAMEFRRIRAVLNRMSKWHPFLPSEMGSSIGIIATRKECAVRVSLRAVRAERRLAASDAAGLDAQYRVVTSLWGVGAAPPADVAAGEEAQPVFLAKDDAARTYALCGENGREGAVVARCETRYIVEEHAAAAPCGDVPAEVLGAAEGETVRQTFAALEAGVLADTVTESARKWLADKVPGELLTASIEPFLRGPAGVEADAPDSTWRRLARLSVDVHTVPVTRLTLGYRDPTDAGGVAPFDVWLCGARQELHFGALPRLWTRKAFGWLAASAAAGVPVGFAVVKLLQSAL